MIKKITAILGSLLLASTVYAEAIKPTEHGSATVISLHYTGGRRPRVRAGPVLTISDSGSVRHVEPYSGIESEMKISPAEVQRTIGYMRDNGFLKLQSDKLRDQVQQRRRELSKGPLMDSTTTVITLSTDTIPHEVSVYALGTHAKLFPDLEDLKRLKAIETRLSWLGRVTRVGGFEELDRLLVLANQSLPARLKLSFARRDLANVRQGQARDLTITLQHAVPNGGTVSVAIMKRPDQPEVVRLLDN